MLVTESRFGFVLFFSTEEDFRGLTMNYQMLS